MGLDTGKGAKATLKMPNIKYSLESRPIDQTGGPTDRPAGGLTGGPSSGLTSGPSGGPTGRKKNRQADEPTD